MELEPTVEQERPEQVEQEQEPTVEQEWPELAPPGQVEQHLVREPSPSALGVEVVAARECHPLSGTA